MPFTQAVTTYTANQFAALQADLHNAMLAGSVPLDPSIMNLLGVTLTSDAVGNGATSCTRTLTVNLATPPFLQTSYNVTATAGTGNWSFFSTNPNDTAAGAGGTGLRTITFTFADTSNTGVLNLNGTTPVVVPNAGHGIVSSFTFGTTGSLGGNAGMIVLVGPPLTGGSAGNLGTLNPLTGMPLQPCIATIPASFYSIYPNAATQPQPFPGWIYNALAQQVGPIVYTAPVLT